MIELTYHASSLFVGIALGAVLTLVLEVLATVAYTVINLKKGGDRRTQQVEWTNHETKQN